MSTALVATTELNNDHYSLSIKVQEGSDLPSSIFIYENEGERVLGSFHGVCGLEDLIRLQEFVGEPIPVFGNRFLRYSEAKIKVSLLDDPDKIIKQVTINVTSLKKAYDANRISTKIIPIL